MESKQATTPRAHKRLWVVAMLMCVVALVAGVYLTYSAYMANDYLKAVAATGATQNLFGSDVLIGYTNEKADEAIDNRDITVDPSGEECSFSFTIYNYLPGDATRVNDKDVNATLTVTATDGKSWNIEQGNKQTPLFDAKGTSLSFPGYKARAYTYIVKFSKADLGKISFLIKAQIGENSPGTNLKMLAAHITPSERATVNVASVTGEWVDEASPVEKFDAYNYRVTVSGATAKVTLAWDDDKVELDPHFPANHSGATFGTKDGKQTVEFTMQPGSEIINFFNTGGQPFDDWLAIDVSCEGETVANETTAEGGNGE